MVVSPTKKESIAKVKHVVAETARFLGEWTEQQVLHHSINERTPYIWPLGKTGYAIGTCRILADHGYWQLQNAHHERIHIFDQKLSAVFYCLLEQKGRFRLAETVKKLDSEVLILKNDIVHYQSSVNRAIKNKRSDAAAIWEARLYDARLLLKTANDQLQKSLTSAKYIKYWE
jgi:hypothetical protein